MKTYTIVLINILCFYLTKGYAQEPEEKKLRISGYIHTQIEILEKEGRAYTGANSGYFSPDIDGKDSKLFLRYGIRKGRIKFEYTQSITKAVFQLDITDNGVKIKDAYYQVTEPWHKIFSIKLGLFDRCFGDEITYSSTKRESPERTFMYRNLFPDERDLGGLLAISLPKGHILEGLKLDAGLYSGNGIRQDDNSRLDFIGHIKYDKLMDDISFGIGSSYYRGSTNNADTLFYSISNSQWSSSQVIANQLNKREYVGVDAQLTFNTLMGVTNIRAEYIRGTQPSISTDFSSPKGNTYNSNSAFNHNRCFMGYHAYLVQNISSTPLSVVLKYAYLDPNIKIKKDEVRNIADLRISSMGIGLIWRLRPELRLQTYYEANYNELSNNLPGFSIDKKDNAFTFRIEYKF